jgi:tryptophanyl-tRNA synthetase
MNYVSGKLLTGELKEILIEKVSAFFWRISAREGRRRLKNPSLHA